MIHLKIIGNFFIFIPFYIRKIKLCVFFYLFLVLCKVLKICFTFIFLIYLKCWPVLTLNPLGCGRCLVVTHVVTLNVSGYGRSLGCVVLVFSLIWGGSGILLIIFWIFFKVLNFRCFSCVPFYILKVVTVIVVIICTFNLYFLGSLIVGVFLFKVIVILPVLIF